MILSDNKELKSDPVFMALRKIVMNTKPGARIVGVDFNQSILAVKHKGAEKPVPESFRVDEIKGIVRLWYVEQPFPVGVQNEETIL